MRIIPLIFQWLAMWLFLIATFVGIGSPLQKSAASAPRGWPGLEKINAPAIDLTRDILGSAARSGDARYHLNCCTHQRAHRRSSGAKRKTLLILEPFRFLMTLPV
jgi:hypothetical protein